MSENTSEYQINLSDDSNSNDSEIFQDLIKVYQKEIKNQKKQILQIPQEISQLMGDANNFYMQKNFKLAQEKLNEIIRKYPNFPEPYHLLGLMQEQKYNFQKAAHFFTIAAELQQNDSELWQKIGFLHKQTKNYEQAQYCFGRCLKKDPLNFLVLQERAACFEKIGDFKKAIKSYLKLVQQDPFNVILIKQVAKLCAKNQQTEKSKELLLPLIYNKEQIDFNIMNILCELYFIDNQYQECLQMLSLVINNQEIPAEIIINLAVCYSNLQFHSQAKFYINKLLKFDIKTYSDLYIKAIDILEKQSININQQDDNSFALEICEQLLNFQNYEDQQTLLKVGQLYQKIQDYDSAIDVYKAIISKYPDQYQAQQELSNIYYKQGNYDKAFNLLENKYTEGVKLNLDDEIFLSDEDEPKQKKFDQQLNPIQKKIKIDHQIYKICQKNLSFTEIIDQEIEKINKNYDYQQLFFFFTQSKQQFENEKLMNDKDFLDKIYLNLLKILQQENEIHKIKKKIMNRYLFESRKKGFAKKIKNQNLQENQYQEQPGVLLLKSQKNNNQEIFLRKSKIKLSKDLTEKHFKNVQYISKNETENELLNYIIKILQNFENQKMTQQIYKISWNSYKLEFLKTYQEAYKTILKFGLISSIQTQKFDKAFQYFKYYVKKNSQSQNVVMIFAQIIYKIEDQNVYRTFLSKLGQRQDKTNLAVQQLTGYSYMKHSYFDLAIQKFLIIHEQDQKNSLICLMLGICYIQSAVSRSTDDKIQQLEKSFQFFQMYKKLRQNENLPETLYNMGRAYSQISYNIQAISFFEQTILECQYQNSHNQIAKKAAYNLYSIHKNMGNIQIAKQISKNYLNYD